MAMRTKGWLLATAGAALLSLGSGETQAAFCVAGGADSTCAINSTTGFTPSTSTGVSFVTLGGTGFDSIRLLGLADNAAGGEVLGAVLGQSSPDFTDDIVPLKLAAGETTDASLIQDLGKIEETATSVGDFSLNAAPSTGPSFGTITYNGPGLPQLNVALKDGAPGGPAAVFALSNITSGATLDYEYFVKTIGGPGSGDIGELSNVQFSTVVPLPAAAWMMIGGLGLIGGAVKWRRRGAAAEA